MASSPSAAPAGTSFAVLVLCAAGVLAVTMGFRQTTGLFVSPINTSTGMGIASISLAMAIGQLLWGVTQPIAGALALRFGAVPVLIGGVLMLSLGAALVPMSHNVWMLSLTLGFLASGGAGVASFSVLMGAVAQRIDPQRRSMASGLINAGGSLGQFAFAPLVAALLLWQGWVHSFWILAALVLLSLPLLWFLRAAPNTPEQSSASAAPSVGLRAQLRVAFADRSYWLLHAGFFTCGFHVAFLVTHLPGEVQLCNMPLTVSSNALALIGAFNIAGSLLAGWLGSRMRMKWILVWMYASRAVAIALFMLAPKTEVTFYIFAAVLGLTWLATVPPTAGLVGKLFGVKHLATLFGLTLLSHQVGGFLGAWLGGVAFSLQGDYTWMWIADMVLAAAAALINLPIAERRLSVKAAPV